VEPGRTQSVELSSFQILYERSGAFEEADCETPGFYSSAMMSKREIFIGKGTEKARKRHGNYT
jgi:hypothetical protein